jgi:aryl-alcohol dehydrogenase-like predicted oxidoreductase
LVWRRPGLTAFCRNDESFRVRTKRFCDEQFVSLGSVRVCRIDPKVPMEDSLGALKEAQNAGKIRHIGLSEVSPEQVERARKSVPIVTVQNRYNITDRKWDETLSYCEKEQIGFMLWAPVGGTRGMSSAASEKIAKEHDINIYQLGLAWLLHRSPVMLPIPGTSSLAHLEENMAARKIQLGPEDWKRTDALMAQAKQRPTGGSFGLSGTFRNR